VVERPDHARRPREAARSRLRTPGAPHDGPTDPRAAAGAGAPLSLLRLDGHQAREHLRPDPVPLAALVRELPPAVRAVQDDLVGASAVPLARIPARAKTPKGGRMRGR